MQKMLTERLDGFLEDGYCRLMRLLGRQIDLPRLLCLEDGRLFFLDDLSRKAQRSLACGALSNGLLPGNDHHCRTTGEEEEEEEERNNRSVSQK